MVIHSEVFGLKLPLLDIPAGSVLRSALAGGLSCALSCSLLHPVDSFKTRVQASTMSFPEIIAQLPQIGARGLYRGSIPAILGQFSSTFLGTAARIPCEVLKQRLQAGLFDNVGEALVATWQQDGLKGFFRGTGATLCHEVPFYVAGMGLCAESKKGVQQLLGRELEAWKQ
ncbi:putative mitochondrial carrier domain-containing protein [Lupinus albus]|uniref:Putative mitochondrial carrier domain-containing protein n=1 Tax=Lupinus albus TaxID=3870 RepID=A0A6A4N443_LUPAL|nr:putative mitochondrial carrier domain-containing protein [Lupinus albus]